MNIVVDSLVEHTSTHSRNRNKKNVAAKFKISMQKMFGPDVKSRYFRITVFVINDSMVSRNTIRSATSKTQPSL